MTSHNSRCGRLCLLVLFGLVVGLTSPLMADTEPGLLETVRERLQVDDASVTQLHPRWQDSRLVLNIRLGKETHEMILRPHSMRNANFQAWARAGDGSVTPIDAPPITTYRGVVPGLDGDVAASVIDGRVQAYIRTADEIWAIQPLESLGIEAPVSQHAVYRQRDLHPQDVLCGVTADLHDVAPAGAPGVAGGGSEDCEVSIAQIAIDTDFEYYVGNGMSEAATITDIETIMNSVELIYARDVGILYSITTIFVQVDSKQPYNATSAGGILSEFRAYWNLTYPGSDPDGNGFDRDVAHLFTGKPNRGVIGVAYLGVICHLDIAYGISLAQWTTNYLLRLQLVAHEIGHNWDAPHCNGADDCGIMCASVNGCSGVNDVFGQDSIASITSFRDSRGCLGTDSPSQLPLAKILSDDGIGNDSEDFDRFGSAIGLDGQTAFISAPLENFENGHPDEQRGAVYVYDQAGFVWSDEDRLQPAEVEQFDRFGQSVAVSGDFAIVGAYHDDGETNGVRDSGAAYVYRRLGNSWSLDAVLRASDGAGSDEFGYAVDIVQDSATTAWAIIGARFDDDAPLSSGSAYIFEFDGTDWIESQKLVSDAREAEERFGSAVAIDYDMDLDRLFAVVGAPRRDFGNPDNGAVFIYALSDDPKTGFELEQVFGVESLEEGNELGNAIDTDVDPVWGESIIIGAHFFGGTGTSYVLRYVDDPKDPGWFLDAELVGFDLEGGDRFGADVAINGRIAVVGADLHDNAPLLNSGSAYMYVFDEESLLWEPKAELTAPDAVNSHRFGRSVAIGGILGEGEFIVLVGATGDVQQGLDAGAVYAFSTDIEFIDCNDNGEPDLCDILNGVSQDCNDNGIPDECDLADDPSLDTNPADGIIDTCQDCDNNGNVDSDDLANCVDDPDCDDCNQNGMLDVCDIDSGASLDVNGNGVPDECETDCNENSVPDFLDISQGTSLDCNANSLPDECEIDLNTPGGPFYCESGCDPDCNQNGIPDFCDILSGSSTDLDGNDVPDECDPDCDNDGIPDQAEINMGTDPDCNLNGIPDSCDIDGGVSEDCNNNGIPDACDIDSGASLDANGNGIPDECEEPCAADLDGSGGVNVIDLLQLLGAWGPCGACVEDINNDGVVSVLDLLELLGAWGAC